MLTSTFRYDTGEVENRLEAGFPLQAYRTETYQKVFKFQNFVNVDWLVLPYSTPKS
jgi:hypothetical protein